MNIVRTLLVDDNRRLMDILAQYLTREAGVQVVDRACSGQEAVAKAAEWSPDLVLMDVAMPVMNGFQATAQIKAHEALAPPAA